MMAAFRPLRKSDARNNATPDRQTKAELFNKIRQKLP